MDSLFFGFFNRRSSTFPHDSLGMYLWDVEDELFRFYVVRQTTIGNINAATIVEVSSLAPSLGLVAVFYV